MQTRPFENLTRDLVKLHHTTVTNAAQVAKAQKPKRKRTVRVTQVKAEVSLTVDAEVLRTALDLAGGDMRRIELLPDGAVLVLNRPRTDKPQHNR